MEQPLLRLTMEITTTADGLESGVRIYRADHAVEYGVVPLRELNTLIEALAAAGSPDLGRWPDWQAMAKEPVPSE